MFVSLSHIYIDTDIDIYPLDGQGGASSLCEIEIRPQG